MRIGRHAIELSHPDKVLFPDDGVTKADLVRYYVDVAEAMIPHLKGRPVMMARYPEGIAKHGFYQKDIPDYFPDWVRRARVTKEGGTVTHVLCDDPATLAYLANQASITPHVWLSRADRPDNPDQMVFDLDPSGDDFGLVVTTARDLRGLLDDVGLPALVKATGSRGLHVVVPLDRRAGFDTVRAFARDIAEVMARRDPDRVTVESRKAKRGDRVFVDVLRNAYAQTAVPPYAVRTLPGAPVATPLRWDELDEQGAGPRRFHLTDLPERLAKTGDLWAGMSRRARSLAGARRRLDALLSEAA
ncbi:MAG TPA: non-homologous end-joining DNA ligase [Acidimicrobiales bacterium]|nr:non-homologous end-joining DNA ligase [Acidimicrobiales bacterium]